MKKQIIPAIIAKDQKQLDKRLNKVKNFSKTFQLDIMDGKFVKNKSFLFDFKLPKAKYEAHLMIKNPEEWIKNNYKKINTFIIHYETTKNLNKLIKFIKTKKKKVGIAINPKTPIKSITKYLKKIDQVLVMTVNPGKYGSKFLPKTLKKVEQLRKKYPKLNIEVDGGIDPETIDLAKDAGANLFASGSFIQKNPKKAIKLLSTALEHKIKVIGFDFDDTLIISEKEKGNISEEIFYNKYKIKGAKKHYIALRGKVNREQKIAIIIKKLTKNKPTKKEIKELSYAFGKGYEFKMASCPLVQCTNMLKDLKKQTKFMFLLSLEDKKTVTNVAKHCQVSKYFDEILGGPKSKIQNFQHILNKHKISPKEAIYIGDSKGDIIKSKKLKIKSIGISPTFNYRKLLKELGANFTFSNLCNVPFHRIMK